MSSRQDLLIGLLKGVGVALILPICIIIYSKIDSISSRIHNIEKKIVAIENRILVIETLMITKGIYIKGEFFPQLESEEKK